MTVTCGLRQFLISGKEKKTLLIAGAFVKEHFDSYKTVNDKME